MAINKNSIDYIKSYLKYALEFEKYVYIWSNAMNTANSYMSQIYESRKELETQRISTHNTLSSLNTVNEQKLIKKTNDAEKCRKSEKSAKNALRAILISLFLLGCVIAILVVCFVDGLTNIAIWFVPLIGLAVMIFGSILTGAVPICLGIIISNKSKAIELEKGLKELKSQSSCHRQQIILNEKKEKIEKNLIVNKKEEEAISERQEEIRKSLSDAKVALTQIYSLNVLPIKYRNLGAVATLYEYLETGRCNTIQGHGGIYDTYETERIQLEQLAQLIQMNERLSRIEDYQRYIYQELEQANKTLSNIKTSLKEIERTNAEIARNTAISAIANQQTAAATQWMAWNAWANGY